MTLNIKITESIDDHDHILLKRKEKDLVTDTTKHCENQSCNTLRYIVGWVLISGSLIIALLSMCRVSEVTVFGRTISEGGGGGGYVKGSVKKAGSAHSWHFVMSS